MWTIHGCGPHGAGGCQRCPTPEAMYMPDTRSLGERCVLTAAVVRRFTRDDGVSGLNLAKSSAARAVRGKIAEQFPFLTDNEILDELIPKKAAVYIAKWCAEAALRGGLSVAAR